MLVDSNLLLSSTPPSLPTGQILSILKDFFAVETRSDIVSLGSERDQNFRVTSTAGVTYVLKISNSAESDLSVSLQTAVARHLQKAAPSLPIQHIVLTPGGDTQVKLPSDIGGNVVRLYTFLDGKPFAAFPAQTSMQRHEIGCALARLTLAMKGFSHPGADHELMWNLANASNVRPLLDFIPDPGRRKIAAGFLDVFDNDIRDRLSRCRTQVIHNDLNPHNILFDASGSVVTGILDLGDVVRAPVIADVAVAAASYLAAGHHPLSGPGDVVRGFHSVLPLQDDELDVLFNLIATRMVLNVSITGWRASRFPQNAAYILKNNDASWHGLKRIQAISRKEARAFFSSICGEMADAHR